MATLNQRIHVATINANPDDKNAVEAALKLKVATGCKVISYTIGPPRHLGMLRELMAMGAKGEHSDCRCELPRFRKPFATSEIPWLLLSRVWR